MPIFIYKAIDPSGNEKEGQINAINVDVAISTLQHQSLIIKTIKSEEQAKGFLGREFTLFQGIKVKDVVMVTRQLAVLFEAQVSTLRVFRLMAREVEKKQMADVLNDVADRIQGGETVSQAMSRHPKVFSNFYVNMVRSGEETGKMDKTFMFLADYIEKNYEMTAKAKSALVYPAFVIATFIIVMILMLTMVIPKMTAILVDSGQDIPVYTRVVMGLADFVTNYGIYLLILGLVGGYFLWKWMQTDEGRASFHEFQMKIPAVGTLFTKLYLSRIASNMATTLDAGIKMVRVLEITKEVVDNKVYEDAFADIIEDVKKGVTVSEAMSRHSVFPSVMVGMVKVGEETGNTGQVLRTLANFYSREVMNAVQALVDLIEPAMIVLLGCGVGILLLSVLVPMYQMTQAF